MQQKQIAENFDKDDTLVSRSLISGPGFLNVFLNRDFVANAVQHNFLTSSAEQQEDQQQQQQHKKTRVVVDFSSPNLAKKMHVGHLRSTIIGDSICRILEYTNEYEVDRVNHLGDWGTQFGMLVAFIKRKYSDSGLSEEKIFESLRSIDELQQCYRDAKKLFDNDNSFKTEAHAEVIALQQPQVTKDEGSSSSSSASVTQRIWKTVCETSKVELHKIYKMLHVKLNDRGESFYAPYISQVIEELEGKQLIQQSNGAKVMFAKIPEMRNNVELLPLMVIKSDGGYTYDTTDLAALWYRLNVQKADWCVYVVDAGQGTHFQLVFEAGKIAGWVNKEKHRLTHVVSNVNFYIR